jgi:hypothetical protein
MPKLNARFPAAQRGGLAAFVFSEQEIGHGRGRSVIAEDAFKMCI